MEGAGEKVRKGPLIHERVKTRVQYRRKFGAAMELFITKRSQEKRKKKKICLKKPAQCGGGGECVQRGQIYRWKTLE